MYKLMSREAVKKSISVAARCYCNSSHNRRITTQRRWRQQLLLFSIVNTMSYFSCFEANIDLFLPYKGLQLDRI